MTVSIPMPNEQPDNAMVSPDGEHLWYPVEYEEALMLADQHDAQPVDEARFAAFFGLSHD